MSGMLKILAVLLVAGAGYFYATSHMGAVKVADVDHRKVSELQLQTIDGPSWEETLQGKWTVLMIGYVTCPDVCPTSLAYASREYKNWKDKIPGTQVIFVSVDPERDKPDMIKKYAEHFHEDFVAVTGALPELETFAKKIGASFEKEESDSAAGYLINHSSRFFFFNPKGKLSGYFSQPHLKGALSKALSKHIYGRS